MKYYILAIIMSTECFAALTPQTEKNHQPGKNEYLANLIKVDPDLRTFYESSEWQNQPTEQTVKFFKNFLARGDFATNTRRIYQVAEEKVPKETLADTKKLIADSIVDQEIEILEKKLATLKNRKAFARKLINQADSPSASS
jgi:hypothetical protein